MKIINKQKFLAELGRLLTFMYEEDRQTALAMYSDLFDSAKDEQSVLQFLVSPTRQAVVIARVYDSKDRKLQVHAESRNAESDDSGETPAFVEAIEKLSREALSLGISAPVVDVNQFSLFEEEAPAAAEESPAVSAAVQNLAGLVFEIDELAEPEVDEEEFELAEPEVQDEYEENIFDLSKEPETVEAEEIPALEESEAVDEKPAEAPVEEAEKDDEAKTMDAVDAFIAEFSIKDEISDAEEEKSEEAQEAAPAEIKEAAPAEEEETAEAVETPAVEEASPEEAAEPAPAAVEPAPIAEPAPIRAIDIDDPIADDFRTPPIKTVRKARPLLLIPYIILLAIPLGAIVSSLLVIPASLFFSVSVTAFAFGIGLLGSAFGSFAMLADMLVVLGAALVLLALGLLFAWLFIWCIVGGIIGFIRALCRLGRKWCYKEVAAE